MSSFRERGDRDPDYPHGKSQKAIDWYEPSSRSNWAPRGPIASRGRFARPSVQYVDDGKRCQDPRPSHRRDFQDPPMNKCRDYFVIVDLYKDRHCAFQTSCIRRLTCVVDVRILQEHCGLWVGYQFDYICFQFEKNDISIHRWT